MYSERKISHLFQIPEARHGKLTKVAILQKEMATFTSTAGLSPVKNSRILPTFHQYYTDMNSRAFCNHGSRGFSGSRPEFGTFQHELQLMF